MLWFVCFFNYADRQALSGVAPQLKDEMGFTAVQMGLIGSAFMWVYAAAAPAAGFIGDRVQRRHLILGGCVFWSLVTVLTGGCRQLWQFVTVRALEGFGETFYFPASMSLISDYHSRRTRSRAMAFHQSGVYAGTILGSWLGAWFAAHYGWRSGFYFFGGVGTVLALVLYSFLREPRREQTPVSGEVTSPPLRVALRDVFEKPTAIALLLVFIGANGVAGVFLFWTPLFLRNKFHFELATAGLTGAVYIHLASACAVPFAGMLADRLARRFAGGRMVAQAAGLLAGAGFIVLVGLTNDVQTLIAGMICFGCCKGFYDSGIFASIYDVVNPRSRAFAAGLMNTVGWAGGALATLLTGWYADHGPHGSDVSNMSHAIAYGGFIYVAGGTLLMITALTLARRDVWGFGKA